MYPVYSVTKAHSVIASAPPRSELQRASDKYRPTGSDQQEDLATLWLRAIEADLGPLNFGLATAWRKAPTRDEWRRIMDTDSNAPAEYALKERIRMPFGSLPKCSGFGTCRLQSFRQHS